MAASYCHGKWPLSVDYDRNDIVVGSWVVNFPLFNPVEESGQTSHVTEESSKPKYPVYNFKNLNPHIIHSLWQRLKIMICWSLIL